MREVETRESAFWVGPFVHVQACRRKLPGALQGFCKGGASRDVSARADCGRRVEAGEQLRGEEDQRRATGAAGPEAQAGLEPAGLSL